MRTTHEELQIILELHKKFLSGDPAGKKAVLQEAELYAANLAYANLSHCRFNQHQF